MKNTYKYFHCDPTDFNSLYNTNRTKQELRQFLAFSIAVAGHHARGTANGMENLLEYSLKLPIYTWGDPFETCGFIHDHEGMDEVISFLQWCGIGCFTSRARSFVEMRDAINNGFDPATANINQLEAMYGISFKTSRFFLLYSRPDQQLAALDTHIWKVVHDHFSDAPKNIPSSSKQYQKWEQKFLSLLKRPEYQHLTPVEFDFYGWDGKRKGTI